MAKDIVRKAEIDTLTTIKAVITQHRGIPEDELRRRVLEFLQKDEEATIMQMIGFSNTWGEWGIDHTNGRMSNATEQIRINIEAGVSDWLKQVKLPKAPKALITKLMKGQTNEIEKQVKSAIKNKIDIIVNAAIEKELEGASLAILAAKEEKLTRLITNNKE